MHVPSNPGLSSAIKCIPGLNVPPEDLHSANPFVMIDLAKYARENQLPPNIAATHAVAKVIDLINNHGETKIEITCGNEKEKGFFAYTRKARQAQDDVSDLTSQSIINTIQNRTSKTIKVEEPKLDGNNRTVVTYLAI